MSGFMMILWATPWKLHGIQEKADISPWVPAPGPPSLLSGPPKPAYLEGRSFTTPEDVAALAQPVLLHRLILSAQARLEGKKEKDVLQEAMRAAKVPVL
ncbi:MAG: hypothetical protein ACLUOI_04615 [Eisenbergiella sp.]